MCRSALIGYTGFVGSNLQQQYDFTDLYNSKNYLKMKSQEYDFVVCAGVSAVKWKANKEPEADLKHIIKLQDVLSTIKTRQFILISTIDVYPVEENENEDFNCESIDNHDYGKHRLAFEKFCYNSFGDISIIRLPGLFGEGLKKNIVYDLLNDNCLEMINTKSSFQYYYLRNLWADIQIVRENKIRLVNFFTEPLSTHEIISIFFPSKILGQKAVREGHYNLFTKYADKWGKTGDYLYSKKEVIEQMSHFIKARTLDEK